VIGEPHALPPAKAARYTGGLWSAVHQDLHLPEGEAQKPSAMIGEYCSRLLRGRRFAGTGAG